MPVKQFVLVHIPHLPGQPLPVTGIGHNLKLIGEFSVALLEGFQANLGLCKVLPELEVALKLERKQNQQMQRPKRKYQM